MKDSDLRILKKIVSEIEYLEKLLDDLRQARRQYARRRRR